MAEQRRCRYRETQFVQEYVFGGGGAEAAAVRCGIPADRARGWAADILQKGWVKRLVNTCRRQQTDRAALTLDKVLTELSHVAFANMADYVLADGSLVPLKELPPEKAAVISQLHVETSTSDNGRTSVLTKRVKLACKNTALNKLLDYFAPPKLRHEHTGANGGPITSVGFQLDLSRLSYAELVEYRRIVALAGRDRSGDSEEEHPPVRYGGEPALRDREAPPDNREVPGQVD